MKKITNMKQFDETYLPGGISSDELKSYDPPQVPNTTKEDDTIDVVVPLVVPVHSEKEKELLMKIRDDLYDHFNASKFIGDSDEQETIKVSVVEFHTLKRIIVDIELKP